MTDVFRVESAAITDVGRKRKNNEDYVLFYEPGSLQEVESEGYLYIVADGVGGEARGECASKYSSHKVLYEYYNRRGEPVAARIQAGMVRADQDIKDFVGQKNLQRMATTMVAAVILGRKLYVVNVGDSRAYLIRGKSIKQITQDHNLVGEMMRSGLISEEESLKSDVKNRLLRSLGGHKEVTAEVFEQHLQPGDRLLLCSDGLTRYTLKENVYHMAVKGSPEQVANGMIQYARQMGGADNISVVLVEVQPYDGKPLQQRGEFPEPVSIAPLCAAFSTVSWAHTMGSL